MFKKIKLIKSSPSSHPFATAVGKKDFSKMGYTEEEHFIYGTANVYEEDGSGYKTIHSDVEYCNRILVRRPTDKSKFSGNVIVEILNPTAMMDLDRMWVISGEHFMRRGDIYIGITSKPDVFNALMSFDSERYKEISWPSPFQRKETPQENVLGKMPLPRSDCETGLFWDMLTDLAILLRSNTSDNPIGDYNIKKIMLTGWSQSACYLWTYITRLAFNESYNKGLTLFDGYFAAGGVYMLAVPLNQAGYTDGIERKYQKLTYMPVPYMAVQTETEGKMSDARSCYQQDSDTAELKYRIYEIAGSTHDNKQTLLDYYFQDNDVAKIDMTPRYMGENDLPNDFPYQYPYNALYEQFFAWVNEGKAPMPSVLLDDSADEYGNTKGGIRSVFVDSPTCTYVNYSDFKGQKFYLFGHVKPFTQTQMKVIYGSEDGYRTAVNKSADLNIEKGFMLKEDRVQVISEALEKGAKYWS